MDNQYISNIKNNLLIIEKKLNMDYIASLDLYLNILLKLRKTLKNQDDINNLENCLEMIFAIRIKILFNNKIFKQAQETYKNSKKFLKQPNKKVDETYKKCIQQNEENKRKIIARKKEESIQKIFSLMKKELNNNNFLSSDKIFKQNTNIIDSIEYAKLKSTYVQKYFKKYNININTEQAIAISLVSQNNLITARAGSGKTRTIACRAIFAIEEVCRSGIA